MGLYEPAAKHHASELLPLVSESESYSLYERSPLWYVRFSVPERGNIRISTGCQDRESATALVESYRRGPHGGPIVRVGDKHIYRMVEHARTRSRKKKVPFGLTIAMVRELFARCKGYCEVTGHALQDSGPFRPSLDRIDCAAGYVMGNVRVVCWITNTAMLHFGETAFAEIAIAYCRTAGLLPLAEE